MDPLTRAAQTFDRQLAVAWRLNASVRLWAAPHHRTHLVRCLRIHEWSPSNRRPLCLVEVSTASLDALYLLTIDQVVADLERVRLGLDSDGVQMSVPGVKTSLPPCDRFRQLVYQAGVALAATGVVTGITVAFIPCNPLSSVVSHQLAADLAAWPPGPHHRLGLAVTGRAQHAELLRPLVPFALDDDALAAYCRAQVERSATAGSPAEAALRRHFLAASDAARSGDMRAARDAYTRAIAELTSQGKRTEADVLHLALGGICFGMKDTRGALMHFDRAAATPAPDQQNLRTQADLGAAGVLLASGDPGAAAARYEHAAEGALSVLRIEALRMAGTCHLQCGQLDAAARTWQAAVAEGSSLPPTTRPHTTWRQAGEALITLFQRRGLAAQASHLRSLLENQEGTP